jgi:hypothetical protein
MKVNESAECVRMTCMKVRAFCSKFSKYAPVT